MTGPVCAAVTAFENHAANQRLLIERLVSRASASSVGRAAVAIRLEDARYLLDVYEKVLVDLQRTPAARTAAQRN